MQSSAPDWSQGYATEMPYTYGFYRELAPAILDTALLARNVSHSADSARYRYCELGCGRGLTTNILAAANPGAEFRATDFNPAHVADAQDLARAAGLDNVRFFEAGFEDFGRQDLPEFDFIALHGIYSWVSPENRAAIVRFIGERLKPGGVVYVSYNTLPGWTQSQPLRRLIHDSVAQGSEPVAERMARAIDIANRMREVNSNYFRVNAQAGSLLDDIGKQKSAYLVHEYYNRDWTALYHADVARELSAAKVAYAAPATLLDHIEALNFNAGQAKLLAEFHDPEYVETLRDFMVNRRFRRDIYVKGARRLPAAESRTRWMALRIALSTPRSRVPMEVEGASAKAVLAPEIYGPLLDALAAGPRTVAELVAGDARIAALKAGALVQAVVMLIGSGHVEPCLDASGDAARAQGTRRLNRAILERTRVSGEVLYLASPVTGSGVFVNRNDQLFLLAEIEKRSDPVAFVANNLAVQGTRVLKDGEALSNPEAALEELRDRHLKFRNETLPVLRQLGITGPSGD